MLTSEEQQLEEVTSYGRQYFPLAAVVGQVKSPFPLSEFSLQCGSLASCILQFRETLHFFPDKIRTFLQCLEWCRLILVHALVSLQSMGIIWSHANCG